MEKTENKIDFKRVTRNIFENEITKYKDFYRQYLLVIKPQRIQALNELNPLVAKLQVYKDRGLLIGDKEFLTLIGHIENFLKKYWGKELLNIFNKEVQYDRPKVKPLKDEGFWIELLSVFAAASQEQQNKIKAHTNYKIGFLNFLKDCLSNQGLYSLIYQRDPRIYKRFNFIVTFKEDREEYYVSRVLLSHAQLESDFLNKFFKKKIS